MLDTCYRSGWRISIYMELQALEAERQSGLAGPPDASADMEGSATPWLGLAAEHLPYSSHIGSNLILVSIVNLARMQALQACDKPHAAYDKNDIELERSLASYSRMLVATKHRS